MKLLDIPDGIRTTVYMTIVDQLRQDPGLKSTIHAGGWRTYIDDDAADAPPTEDTLPSLEVLPFGGAANPATLVTQDSPMGIAVSIAVEGTDVRDLLNLWELVEAALWKGSGPSALLGRLKEQLAGLARPGQIAIVALTNPAVTPDVSALGRQILVASGTLNVQLRVPK